MNYISMMMGISLCALLMTSVMQALLTAKKTFLENQNHAQFLNTGHTAMQYLARDIKSAGYRGWRSGDFSFPLTVQISDWNPNLAYLLQEKKERTILGFKAQPGACYGKMPISACKRVKENTEVIIIYQVAQKINPLLQTMQKPNEPLMLPSHHGIHNGALVLISDGFQGDLFLANKINGPLVFHEKRLGLNISDDISKNYVQGTEVVELQTVAYYLGVPERLLLSGSAVAGSTTPVSFSLFRDDFLQNAQEVIAGVRDVEFEYGLQKSFEEELIYYRAGEISEENWNWVQTVRVHLTMENGKGWHFEIALRNRLLPHLNLGFFSSHFLDRYSYRISKSIIV